MKKVREYVTDASYQLNDQRLGREFTRWERARLISYLNDGLAELSCYRPEEFSSLVNLTLVAGHRQSANAPTQRVVSINANADGSFVSEADLDLLRAFAPHNCCAAEVVFDAQGNPYYKARSYCIDPKETRAFYVSPPVPNGLTPTVKATVVTVPAYTLADWEVDVPVDAKYQTALIDFIQGRAHDIDMESPMARQLADKHLGRFYNMLGVKYRYESAFRAGNWNGMTGDGDPRAHV